MAVAGFDLEVFVGPEKVRETLETVVADVETLPVPCKISNFAQ